MAGQKRSGLQQRFSPDGDLAHAGGVVDLSLSRPLRRSVLQSEPTHVDSPRSDEFAESDDSPKSARSEPERLWREVVGGQLRQVRVDRSLRLLAHLALASENSHCARIGSPRLCRLPPRRAMQAVAGGRVRSASPLDPFIRDGLVKMRPPRGEHAGAPQAAGRVPITLSTMP